MKGIARFLIIFVMALVPFSSFGSDGVYAENNTEKKDWFLAAKTLAEDKLRDFVEGAVNDFFEEPMYELLGRGIGAAFGESFAKSFSGIISIGPFISIDSLIGSFGASEGQVMTRVLLKAIEQAKEEIIASVDQLYRDETSSVIDALIANLEIYNARSEGDRQVLFHQLGNYIDEATLVLSRIEVKPGYLIEDIHPYMAVAALRVSMQMEYTKWVKKNVDPDATDEEIQQEIDNVLAVQVSQVNDFITTSRLGLVDFWKNEFYSEFSGDVRFVRPANQADLAGKSDYFLDGSTVYSYRMDEGDIEFLVARRKDYCKWVFSGENDITRKYDIFDVAGEVVKSLFWTHSSDESPDGYDQDYYSHCSYAENQLSQINRTGLFSRIAGYPTVRPEPINAHKYDVEALNLYLVDGYLPMKRMLDSWWQVKGSVPRPKSEVDLYVESHFGNRAEITLEKVEVVELGENATGQDQYRSIYEITNVGFADASVEFSVADGWPFGGNTVVEGFIVDSVIVPIANCTSSKVCDIGTIEVDEGIQVAVLVTPSSYDTAYFTVRADSDVPQLTPRGKSISDRVEIEEEPCSSWFCL